MPQGEQNGGTNGNPGGGTTKGSKEEQRLMVAVRVRPMKDDETYKALHVFNSKVRSGLFRGVTRGQGITPVGALCLGKAVLKEILGKIRPQIQT